MLYAVVLHCQIIGIYTSVTDASLVQKQSLNTETHIGAQMLRSPA
eukprot:SAG25_NODE_73_length_17157_cov_11.762575_3_plen_45_part_00